ncbi:hypothetical protein ACFQ10_00070 [Streptomyces indonesiensis]
MGAQVTFEDRTWQVAALVGGRVHLVADDGATACVVAAYLVAAPGFSVIGMAAVAPPAPALWEAVPLAAQERALAWQRHIREVETGLPDAPEKCGVPRPEYDPQRFTLAEREGAKARELTALGWARVSRTTVQRMRLVYRRQGLWGLVDSATCAPRPLPGVLTSGWWPLCWRPCADAAAAGRPPPGRSSSWLSRSWRTPTGRTG